MFKKHVTEVNSSPLSGKDVKTLKKDIQTTYRLSDEQIKKLFPSKADLVVQKLSNKAKTFACTGENPLFFDPDGRGNVLLPTIYALWQCPELLPKIYTYSEVSPKVCTVAFLAFQGLHRSVWDILYHSNLAAKPLPAFDSLCCDTCHSWLSCQTCIQPSIMPLHFPPLHVRHTLPRYRSITSQHAEVPHYIAGVGRGRLVPAGLHRVR